MTKAQAGAHLFVSYATADRERALAIADTLEAAGVSVWIDRRGIPGGTDWASQIAQAVRSCSAIAVLCSVASVASRNVRQELQLAWDHDKPILPLLLEQIEFPDSVAYFLQGRQWIEVHGRAEDQWVADIAQAFGGSLPPPGQSFASASPVGNLPAPATQLVGREDEVERIVTFLGRDDVRLVTLTGPGGVGKTRLALAVAERLTSSFPNGVWLVRLAPVRDPALVIPTIAQTLGIRDEGTLPLTDRLRSYLKEKRLLLVIDNIEHLIAAAPELADLLAHGPGVTLLVTSRTVLRVSGEREYLVDPLVAPGHTPSLLSAADVGSFPSVRLFVQRAAAAKPGFALTDENASSVAGICARLDGLPLALEIAAARIKLLSPPALFDRLEKRLPLLTGGARDLPVHQQTLRDAIAWSYDLLSPDEQVLFGRLAVFVGGCTLEAAESVVSPEHEIEMFDGLASLVDKSLLRLDDTTDEPRFRMLETIREFATERLEASGEAEATRDRHAEWCLHLTETLNTGMRFLPSLAQTARVAADHDNLRAALGYLEGVSNSHEFLRLAIESSAYWWVRGYMAEGLSWNERALAIADGTPDTLRGLVLTDAGLYAYALGDSARALEYIEHGQAILQSVGGDWERAYGAFALGSVLVGQEKYVDAAAHFETALAAFTELGDMDWSAFMDGYLGIVAFGLGDRVTARTRLTTALEVLSTRSNPWCTGILLEYRGFLDTLDGNGRAAVAALEASIAIWLDYGSTERIADWLMKVVVLGSRAAASAAVAQLVGAAEAIQDSLGSIWELPELSYYEQAIFALREALGESAYQDAWTAGALLTPNQACAEGLALLRSLEARPDV